MIMDWQLGADGQIAAGFASMMEAGMAGRIGNTVTINGIVPVDKPPLAYSLDRLQGRLVTHGGRYFADDRLTVADRKVSSGSVI